MLWGAEVVVGHLGQGAQIGGHEAENTIQIERYYAGHVVLLLVGGQDARHGVDRRWEVLLNP